MRTRLFFLFFSIVLIFAYEINEPEVQMSDNNFVPPSLTQIEKDKLLACAEIISSKLSLDNVFLFNIENYRRHF